MIKFLIERPIAVLMGFTACFVIGLITYFMLPVSLLPDIAIPEITVQVSCKNTSARELENTVMKPIRYQLLQVSTLEDLSSETHDGNGIIRLKFDYGVNTDLAFIEVNEKIDAIMNYLPKATERPKVVKASATDIPVFYLNLTLKKDHAYSKTNQQAFMKLSEFSESVIKRRIEQLPQIAMVDVTGGIKSRLQIVPDKNKMQMLGITVKEIESALAENNVEPGSMRVRDGYYEYNIKISTLLRTVEDVANIYIRKGARLLQLKDFCRIAIAPEKERGMSISGGKRAITLAIIKQADENMDDVKEALEATMTDLKEKYPAIDFSISRNQTELLDYTISNLQQNLTLGFFLICVVAILFLGDIKSPFIIGLSMVVSIVISFLFFYLFKVSLNIISLSGLILALGMMIDSSIIVTENISQYRERGYSLRRACVAGTNEVITPMLSSSLTTIAVFLPLIFMSGIAGALFYDQAFSVAVGLLVAYFTGIMLLPVLYLLVYRTGLYMRKWKFGKLTINLSHRNQILNSFYDRGMSWIFHHKTIGGVFCLISLPICVFFFFYLEKERMPKIDENELLVRIDWNENIHIQENRCRIDKLFAEYQRKTVLQEAAVGQQDYVLKRDCQLSSTEAELYFKISRTDEIENLQKEIHQYLRINYPLAVVQFSPPETIFEKLFVTNEPDIVLELYPRNKETEPDIQSLKQLEQDILTETGYASIGVAFQEQLNLRIDQEKLLLYHISYDAVYRVLKTAFKENEVGVLHSFQQYLPINIVEEEKTVNRILQETLIKTTPQHGIEAINEIPLQELVQVVPTQDLKTLVAGREGEYIPFPFYQVKAPHKLMSNVKTVIDKTKNWEASFSGSFFSNRKMLDELTIILFISLLLMYFILAAQFESFVQPLLVLLEIPIDIAFALLLLWICGQTLNLMSAIGIIVTCGIVINDSILKLDAINELRKSGVPLLEAIHESGRRRLRPIIMTSLTTIFVMVPLLFSHDMGSELQQPLSIAMIGTMLIGTLVSLFIVPLLYWFIYGHQEKKKA